MRWPARPHGRPSSSRITGSASDDPASPRMGSRLGSHNSSSLAAEHGRRQPPPITSSGLQPASPMASTERRPRSISKHGGRSSPNGTTNHGFSLRGFASGPHPRQSSRPRFGGFFTCHSSAIFTGKKSSFGKQRTWRGQKISKGGFGLKPTGITRRKFRPNLQKVTAMIDGKATIIMASTKAIKQGLVVKAPSSDATATPACRRRAAGARSK